ncbi:hypothetical protein [Halobacillus mangrovi]|uniref:hypothetical protein n=1 Tax=Halobacillus mangrovi TaxID=402384 RepID=UPI003D95EC97
MNKSLHSFSNILLGLCILIGCWLISQSVANSKDTPSPIQNRDVQVDVEKEDGYKYEIISANESNLIIFDKESGEYWRKAIAPSEGPAEWEMEESPVSPSTSIQY